MPDMTIRAAARGDGRSRALAGRPRPTVRRPPGCRRAASGVRALVVHGDDVPLGAAAVLRAADVRQDGAAGARRLAVGMGCRRSSSSRPRCWSATAMRIFLIARASTPADRLDPPGRMPAGVSGAADRAARRAGASRPPGEPYLWQIGLFTVAIGLPFLAVSANAPLLQAWFARTGHPHGHDPYFLYAASNLGSLIALLGYPFILEPAFGLKELSRLWALGFLLLVVALALVFVVMRTCQSELGGRGCRRRRLGIWRSRCRAIRAARMDGSPGLDRPGARAGGTAHGVHHTRHH